MASHPCCLFGEHLSVMVAEAITAESRSEERRESCFGPLISRHLAACSRLHRWPLRHPHNAVAADSGLTG